MEEMELEALDERYLLTNWLEDDLVPIAEWAQSQFLPTIGRLEDSVTQHFVPLPHVSQVDLLVGMEPGDDNIRLDRPNLPLLHFVAEIDRENGNSVIVIKQDVRDDWIQTFIPRLRECMPKWVQESTPAIELPGSDI